MPEWPNRIVDRDEHVDPSTLIANPDNWRTHPRTQEEALGGVLDDVGWVQPIIVNRNTGNVIDGHLRVSMALARGSTVPVVYVDLTEDEEKVILASLDPIAGMAQTDDVALRELVESINTESQAVQKLVRDLAGLEEALPSSNDDEPLPGSGVKTPSQRQIDNTAAKRETVFEERDGERHGQLVDLTCPSCGEEFALRRDEVLRDRGRV